jgi:hypothetical protein
MRNALVALVVLVATAGSANAYDIGGLTCQRIGELAAETLVAKQAGKEFEPELTRLVSPLASEAKVERKLVTNIVTIIYQNDLIVAMKPDDAYMMFMGDCMRGQREDRGR